MSEVRLVATLGNITPAPDPDRKRPGRGSRVVVVALDADREHPVCHAIDEWGTVWTFNAAALVFDHPQVQP